LVLQVFEFIHSFYRKQKTVLEGVEAGHADPEGALNLQLRIARDHLVLSVWPVKVS